MRSFLTTFAPCSDGHYILFAQIHYSNLHLEGEYKSESIHNGVCAISVGSSIVYRGSARPE